MGKVVPGRKATACQDDDIDPQRMTGVATPVRKKSKKEDSGCGWEGGGHHALEVVHFFHFQLPRVRLILHTFHKLVFNNYQKKATHNKRSHRL